MQCSGEVFKALLTTPHLHEGLYKVIWVRSGEVSFQHLTLGSTYKSFANSKKVRCEVFLAYFVWRIGILFQLIREPSCSVTTMTELSPNLDLAKS